MSRFTVGFGHVGADDVIAKNRAFVFFFFGLSFFFFLLLCVPNRIPRGGWSDSVFFGIWKKKGKRKKTQEKSFSWICCVHVTKKIRTKKKKCGGFAWWMAVCLERLVAENDDMAAGFRSLLSLWRRNACVGVRRQWWTMVRFATFVWVLRVEFCVGSAA